MRKTMLLIAAFAIVAAPNAAFAKHKKGHHRAAHHAVAPTDPNEYGRRLVWNGLGVIFVPFTSVWAQPVPVVAKY